MPTAYFVRHGQTDWNAAGRLQGQAETELNELGRLQARRNGRVLSEFAFASGDELDFVASPLRRTQETMRILRAAMGLPAEGFRLDPRLLEVHFGDWQGLTLAEVDERQPGSTAARDADKWRFLPPGRSAESYEMLCGRFRPWLDELERPTVCVTHGGIIRAVLHLVGGMKAADAAALVVPQDKILVMEGNRLDWR